jgi:outer membrane protein assembly factor BamB
MFQVFGGAHNYVLVGTRYTQGTGENAFYGLDPSNLAQVFEFTGGTGGKIGIINFQATVDYANQRVYFTSYPWDPSPVATQDNRTVWCLDVSGPSPVLRWARAVPNVSTSPTLRGNRLYVGTSDGKVIALDTTTGSPTGAQVFEIATADGPVKGFVQTDRIGGQDIYFATTNKVWAYQDDGSAFPTPKPWPGPPAGSRSLPSPSTPVLFQGTGRLYVGSGDGQLYVLSTADGSDASAPIALGDPFTPATVGSPTLDTRANALYVGSEGGVIYYVQLP